MTSRIEAALEAIGLSNEYLEEFKREGINDSSAAVYFKFPSMLKNLEAVIPFPEDLQLFKEAFLNPREVPVAKTDTKKEYVRVKNSSTANLIPITNASNNLMKYKNWRMSSIASSTFQSRLLKSIDINWPATGPVQIIEISLNKTKETDSSPVDRLIFKGEQLKEILSKVGSRPVALLSIAGPSRQGKSFILGYMLKYLRSLSQSQSTSSSHSNSVSDWMGGKAETKKAPLEDGFKWRFGTMRETVGIWMWPEPFTLKSADGKEFDVLLVDTQGVFDAHTDKKDWATIVGLSLLTSSCLILNIMQHLQEDSLNTLKDFMDFGLMAKDSADQGKPFQKLVFLIRDWGLEDEFPFGFKGGQEYLQENLGENNTEAGRQIRSQIKECFQQLDCFLMPDPGKKVKKKDYDGSVADMDEDFAQNVQDFIENLFDPSTFPAKVISGEMVTGDDLYTHFEQYLKIFNSSTMPSPEDMNQATILICNQSVVNKCFKHYEDIMQKNLEKIQREFVLEKELLESHTMAQEEASELFGKSRKMGTSEEIDKSEGLLAQEIGDCYKAVVAEDAVHRNEIIKKEVQNLQEFLISLEDNIKQYYSGPDNFIVEPQFDAYYDECYLLATKQLAAFLQLESLSLLDKEETLGFENYFKLWRANLEKINQSRKTMAQSTLLERQGALLDTYVSEMKESLQEYQYWTSEDFQRLHTYYSKESLESFSQEYKGSVLFQEGHQKLIQNFEKECQNLEETVNLKNEKFLFECSQCVTNIVKVYSDKMEANLNAHNLKAIGVAQEDRCEYELKGIKDFDRLPREKYENFVKDLYDRTLKEHSRLLEKYYSLITKALLQKYKDAFKNFYGNAETIFEEDVLQKKHSIEKEAVLSEFKDLLGEIATAGRNAGQSSDEAVTDFIDEIEAHLKIIAKENARRIKELKKTVEGYLAKAKNIYFNRSHKINASAFNSSDLQTHSNAAKKEVQEFFKAECRTKANVDPPVDLVEELETFVRVLPEFQRRGSSNIIKMIGIGPLPILEMTESKITINEGTLKLVLEKVGTHPFVVYSINGDTRSGKSYLLNYFVRYLEFYKNKNKSAKDFEQATQDWFNTPPTSDFKCRGGRERTTVGIDIWPEPYFVSTEEGPLAILLLDTQGLFDDKTPPWQNERIFSISNLLSSVMIINHMQNINDDLLNKINTFSQKNDYSLQTSNIPTAPNTNIKNFLFRDIFQQLTFVIRDFSFPGYNYGMHDQSMAPEGSSSNLFKDIFCSDVETNAMPEENRRMRENILQMFQNVSLYAMPDPGKEFKRCDAQERNEGSAAQAIQNDLQISRKSLIIEPDEDFQEHLKSFIEWILSPENLVKKKVFGIVADGTIFIQYIHELAKSYETAAGTISREPPMTENTENIALTHYTEAKQLVFALYAHHLNERMHDTDNVTSLAGTHLSTLDAFLELFDRMKKIEIDNVDFKQRFRNALEMDINRHFLEKLADRKEALQVIGNRYLFKSKNVYLATSASINEAFYEESKYNEIFETNRDGVLRSLGTNCKAYEDFGMPTKGLSLELDNYIASIPQFMIIGKDTILVSGPSLKLMRELLTLEKIGNLTIPLKEIRWIAHRKLTIDRDLTGEFWAGKNVLIYAPEIHVIGNLHVIDVSGKAGKSASNTNQGNPIPVNTQETPPEEMFWGNIFGDIAPSRINLFRQMSTSSNESSEYGVNGLNGEDGEPGECGGNITVIATNILNASNLRLISNGGAGGNGQPGGNGTNGQDGTDGNDRYRHKPIADLKQMFPTPARVFKGASNTNLAIGEESLESLASKNGVENVESWKVINRECRYWVLTTKEGARIHYSFFEGSVEGASEIRSFYLWCQGAPGTAGQLGGHGGLGGRGGVGGSPGDISIHIPGIYGDNLTLERNVGQTGSAGENGKKGQCGIDGDQGTDYAYIDPYARYLVVPKDRQYDFSGNLKIQVGLTKPDGSTLSSGKAAYCPYHQNYISFYTTTEEREVLTVFEKPEEPTWACAVKKSSAKEPINIEKLKKQYGIQFL